MSKPKKKASRSPAGKGKDSSVRPYIKLGKNNKQNKITIVRDSHKEYNCCGAKRFKRKGKKRNNAARRKELDGNAVMGMNLGAIRNGMDYIAPYLPPGARPPPPGPPGGGPGERPPVRLGLPDDGARYEPMDIEHPMEVRRLHARRIAALNAENRFREGMEIEDPQLQRSREEEFNFVAAANRVQQPEGEDYEMIFRPPLPQRYRYLPNLPAITESNVVKQRGVPRPQQEPEEMIFRPPLQFPQNPQNPQNLQKQTLKKQQSLSNYQSFQTPPSSAFLSERSRMEDESMGSYVEPIPRNQEEEAARIRREREVLLEEENLRLRGYVPPPLVNQSAEARKYEEERRRVREEENKVPARLNETPVLPDRTVALNSRTVDLNSRTLALDSIAPRDRTQALNTLSLAQSEIGKKREQTNRDFRMLIDDLSEIKEGSIPSADESIDVVRNLKREIKEEQRKQQAPAKLIKANIPKDLIPKITSLPNQLPSQQKKQDEFPVPKPRIKVTYSEPSQQFSAAFNTQRPEQQQQLQIQRVQTAPPPKPGLQRNMSGLSRVSTLPPPEDLEQFEEPELKQLYQDEYERNILLKQMEYERQNTNVQQLLREQLQAQQEAQEQLILRNAQRFDQQRLQQEIELQNQLLQQQQQHQPQQQLPVQQQQPQINDAQQRLAEVQQQISSLPQTGVVQDNQAILQKLQSIQDILAPAIEKSRIVQEPRALTKKDRVRGRQQEQFDTDIDITDQSQLKRAPSKKKQPSKQERLEPVQVDQDPNLIVNPNIPMRDPPIIQQDILKKDEEEKEKKEEQKDKVSPTTSIERGRSKRKRAEEKEKQEVVAKSKSKKITKESRSKSRPQTRSQTRSKTPIRADLIKRGPTPQKKQIHINDVRSYREIFEEQMAKAAAARKARSERFLKREEQKRNRQKKKDDDEKEGKGSRADNNPSSPPGGEGVMGHQIVDFCKDDDEFVGLADSKNLGDLSRFIDKHGDTDQYIILLHNNHYSTIYFDHELKTVAYYDSLAKGIPKFVMKFIDKVFAQTPRKVHYKLKYNNVPMQKDGDPNCATFVLDFIDKYQDTKNFAHASGFDKTVDENEKDKRQLRQTIFPLI